MFKRSLLILLVCAFIFTSVACSSKKNEESVLVKESSDFNMLSLEEASLLEPIEFTKDGISVILDSILYDEHLTRFSFNIKNDTEKNFKILVTDLSINGIMYHGFMENDIEFKTSKNAFFEISNEWFSSSLIEVIKELEFTVRLLDENSSEIANSDILKASTDAPEDYVQKYNKTGTTLFESKDAAILSQGLHKSKYSEDLELSFYIENNTNSHFSVIANEVYVNEKLSTPTFIVSVGSNKKATEPMLFTKEELTGAKIDSITSVKASFKAIDKNSNIVFETPVLDIPLK